MHVPDTEYLVAAADPDEYYRVSEPVREREPDGDRGAGDRGDGGEYGGGGGVLQDSGREAEDVSSSLKILAGVAIEQADTITICQLVLCYFIPKI